MPKLRRALQGQSGEKFCDDLYRNFCHQGDGLLREVASALDLYADGLQMGELNAVVLNVDARLFAAKLRIMARQIREA